MSTRKVSVTLLIATFLYLMMCPVVQKIIPENNNQNIIVKIDKESSDKQSKKNSAGKFADELVRAASGIAGRPEVIPGFLPCAAPAPPAILALLSTVILVL